MKNIVVIGAGLIGSRHADSVASHPDCRLVGIIEPDINRCTNSHYRYFADIDEVSIEVDGAIIAVPTGLHITVGIQAVKRGWHLLIEKPVATTVNEANQLIEIAKKNEVRCLVGHHRRYHESIKILHDVIKQGLIGMPVTSTTIWAVKKPNDYFLNNWRTHAGSPVMINLIHDIDLLRYVLGDIVDVKGLAAAHIRQSGRIESGAVALRFASGACGTISFADTAPSPWGFESATAENPNIASTGQDMWWITGTLGGVAFPSLTQWNGAADWSEAPISKKIQHQPTNPLNAQLEHFLSVIEGSVPHIDIADAQESLRVVERVQAELTNTLIY